MKRIVVAAVALVEGKKVLVTQRGYGEFQGGWEFPGGKEEPGETLEQTAKREIEEELKIEIEITRKLVTVEYDYPRFHLTMTLFAARKTSGKITFVEAEDARLVTAEELDSVPFLPADKSAIPALKEYLVSLS